MVYIGSILVYAMVMGFIFSNKHHRGAQAPHSRRISAPFPRISEASVYSRFNWYVPAAVFPAISGKDHERPPTSQHDVPGMNPFEVNERGYEQLPFIVDLLVKKDAFP